MLDALKVIHERLQAMKGRRQFSIQLSVYHFASKSIASSGLRSTMGPKIPACCAIKKRNGGFENYSAFQ